MKAEKVVPLRIPRCSFGCSRRGSMPFSRRAFQEERICRGPNRDRPVNTWINGLAIRVPAIYKRGERSG